MTQGKERERERDGERDGESDGEKERERFTPPTTCGPSVGLLCHPCIPTTHFSYRFPIFETSATALRGASGII